MGQWWEVIGPDGSVHKAATEAEAQRIAWQRSLDPKPLPAPPNPSTFEAPSLGDRYQKIHPIARFGLETLGAVGAGAMMSSGVGAGVGAAAASRLPMVAGAASKLMKLPRVAKLFGRGAAEGAGTGALLADEDEARQGALLGGGLGGAVGGGVPYAGKAFRGARRLYGDISDPARYANRTLANTLEGTDPSVLQAPGGTVADLHPGVAKLVADRAPHDARREFVETLARRQEGGEGRIVGELNRALDNPPATAAVERMRKMRTAEATRLYAPVMDQVIPGKTRTLMRKLQDRPDFIDGMARGQKNIANKFGTEEAANSNTVRFMHETLQAMKIEKDRLYNIGDTYRAGILNNNFYVPLKESLENALPQYKKASAFALETGKRDDAFNAGLHLFDRATPKGTAKLPGTTTKELAKMSPIQRKHFRAGVMDNLFQGVSQLDQAANIIAAFSNRGTKSQLRAALDADSFGALQEFVNTETKFWKTYVAAQGAGADLPSTLNEVIQTGGDIVRTGIWYTPWAFTSMTQRILKNVVGQNDDEIYREMVKTLLSPDMPTVSPLGGAIGRPGLGAGAAATVAPRDNRR